ncbi:MAG: hypothetical protein MJ211_09840 [Bacteroidales bacterium]|nr:hypothetical protein [Bacteroidales bacterium]
MALYLNVGDKIKIFNVSCSVIGLSILLYKSENSEFHAYAVYKLSKNKDNSIWYLEDDIDYNVYRLYYKTNKIDLIPIRTIKHYYYVLKNIGDTDLDKNVVLYHYFDTNYNFNLLINEEINCHGRFIKRSDIIKVNSIEYNEDPLQFFLPDITKFHEENVIKNQSCSIEEGFDIGDGLLINDQEYFVLSKSISTYNSNFNNQYNEFKLYNNNEKKYCRLINIQDKYYIFSPSTKIETYKLISKGKKRRTSCFADWETINNIECDYKLYQGIKGGFSLQERHEKSQGFEFDFSTISVLKYNYLASKPWLNSEIFSLKHSTENKKEEPSTFSIVHIFFFFSLLIVFFHLFAKYHNMLFLLVIISIVALYIFIKIKISNNKLKKEITPEDFVNYFKGNKKKANNIILFAL